MKRLAVLVAAAAAFGAIARADALAVYRAAGADARLFDQYDNDGYSLAVAPREGGELELSVRVSAMPLSSRAPFPTGLAREASLATSLERDAFARTLAGDATTQARAVERILAGVASLVRYDTDRSRRQDPASVFASRRGHCVGISELAVDLLRRVGIPARTVQGVLTAKPGSEGYEARIGGVFHRWIEVYYPDTGFVFSDPSSSINSVDARYVPFKPRALERPRELRLKQVEASGRLDYPVHRLPEVTLRIRPASR
ncbi:MAG: transglutaminase-like domain-containing protein [Thermoanaerobaculia bacterium]